MRPASRRRRVLRRAGGAALAVALSVAWGETAAPAEETLIVDARPAWGGVARAGAWTEISVDVVSEAGGRVAAMADAGLGTISVAQSVDAGVPVTLRLPVRIGEGGAIELVVGGPSGAWSGGLGVRPAPADARVVARPATVALDPRLAVLAVDMVPERVPVTPRAFAVVDLVIVDAPTLGRLGAAARAALDAYVAGCGRLFAVGLPEVDGARLRGAAGCGGEFVGAAPAGAPIAEAVARLLARRAPPPALAPATLSVAPTPPAARPLLGFFALYGVALAFGALAVRRVWLLAAIPAAATILLAIGLAGAGPRVTVVAVAEGEGDAPAARVAARIRVDGIGRTAAVLAVPAPLGPPDATPAGAAESVVEREGTRVTVGVPLGGRRVLDVAGVVPWEPPVRLVVAADGPRVEGRGPGAAGWLVWRRRVLALPALAPGGAWRPTDAAASPAAAVPGWLDALRRATDGPLVVLPGGPAVLAGIAGEIVDRAAGAEPTVVTVIRPEAR